MKGIVLAAGQGTRLRPLTDDRPKCMVAYQGRPLIDIILQTLCGCGVSPLVVVGGYRADVLEEHTRPYSPRMIVNADYMTTNMVHSLFCAESELNDNIIISYSDIIYHSNVVEPLLNCTADLAITIDKNWRTLWEQRMADPLADAETLILNGEGYIVDLGRKPKSYDEIQGQYMGLIKVSGRIWDEVKLIYRGLDRDMLYDGKSFGQMYMTTFLRELIRAGLPCLAVPVYGGWLEVDSPSDLSLPF